MPYVDTPGARIWFGDTGGSGHPVVFAHPATGTAQVWAEQVTAFTQWGYRVITYDRRGAGHSSIRPDTDSGNHAGDLAHLMDQLDLPSAHLVGAALGACDVLEYAVAQPSRTRSIVVSNSYGGLDDSGYRATIARLWHPELLRLPPHVLELSPTFRGTCPDRVATWLAIYSNAAPEPPDDELPMGVSRHDLEALRMPALVIAGSADLLAPPFLMEQLSRYIPGAEFTVIHDSGHAAHFEQPETWNARVATFLQSQERPAR